MNKKFLSSNKTRDRLLRTILQGVIGVLIANLDLLISGLTIPTEYKPMIVALVMAVLSPIMSELGKKDDSNTALNIEKTMEDLSGYVAEYVEEPEDAEIFESEVNIHGDE